MRTALVGGRILDPSRDLDIVGTVVIENAQVVECGVDVKALPDDSTVDCQGLWVSPGLVDMHAHLREPGEVHRETIATGTQAAAAGGFTTVCCMPNTSPPLDSPTLIDFIVDRAASPKAGGIFVAPIGALTVGLRGEQVCDLAALKAAGVVAASDEGGPIQNSAVMMRAMEQAEQVGLPLLLHCEDTALTGQGVMNDGAMSAMLGLKGIPRCAEEVAVMRNCLLSLHTGCRIHILRVSTWGSVELVRQAKYLGAPVTCEVCPHHFAFTDEDVAEFDVHFKTTPPLRSEVDVDILLQALNDGTVDAIASDHSPFATYEINTPFDEAPFGMASLECTLAATLTYCTQSGALSPLETIRKLSTNPAQILGLDAGNIAPGGTPVAQIALIDPNHEWTFDRSRTFTKGKNSPFHDVAMMGKCVMTLCGSEVYRDSAFDEGRLSAATAL